MSTNAESVVTVTDASIFQDGNPILTQVNFNVRPGEFVYLIGRTGSGKSSLLKTLYADLAFLSGEIDVAGFRLQKIKRKQIAYLRRKMGIVFQDFQLLSDRTVAENLIFVMKATGWKDTSSMKSKLADLLMRVGLANSANKFPHQLSGGEQQRIVIARALINNPTIILADEPTGNLDPEVADGIMKLFQEINRGGTSILMATHNHQFLNKYPARVLKVEHGRVLDSEKESFRYGNE